MKPTFSAWPAGSLTELKVGGPTRYLSVSSWTLIVCTHSSNDAVPRPLPTATPTNPVPSVALYVMTGFPGRTITVTGLVFEACQPLGRTSEYPYVLLV